MLLPIYTTIVVRHHQFINGLLLWWWWWCWMMMIILMLLNLIVFVRVSVYVCECVYGQWLCTMLWYVQHWSAVQVADRSCSIIMLIWCDVTVQRDAISILLYYIINVYMFVLCMCALVTWLAIHWCNTLTHTHTLSVMRCSLQSIINDYIRWD